MELVVVLVGGVADDRRKLHLRFSLGVAGAMEVGGVWVASTACLTFLPANKFLIHFLAFPIISLGLSSKLFHEL